MFIFVMSCLYWNFVFVFDFLASSLMSTMYVLQKIEGNKNSQNSLNLMVNCHYHGENRVINHYFPYIVKGDYTDYT